MRKCARCWNWSPQRLCPACQYRNVDLPGWLRDLALTRSLEDEVSAMRHARRMLEHRCGT